MKELPVSKSLLPFLTIISTILTFLTVYIRPSHKSASKYALGYPFRFVYYHDLHLPPEGMIFVFTPPHILRINFQLLGFFLNLAGIFATLLLIALIFDFSLKVVTRNDEEFRG